MATLVVTPGDGRVTLSWDSVPGVSGYDIHWSIIDDTSTAGQRILGDGWAIISSHFNFYIHNELYNGKTYCYLVAPIGQEPVGDCIPAVPGSQGCDSLSQVNCGGSCVYLYSDEANCGVCGKKCAAGQTCENGGCVDEPSATCKDNLDICSGVCAELLTDVSNCGNCGTVCPAGRECRNGICVGEGLGSCSPPLKTCGGSCVNLLVDKTNCGTCGITCGTGQFCSAGSCVCNLAGANPDLCSGVCTDRQTDDNNCGACGIVCGPGGTCQAGACVCNPAGTNPDLCGGVCTDKQTDANNCGVYVGVYGAAIMVR